MKKFIAAAIALSLTPSSFADKQTSDRVLTQEEINEFLNKARNNGNKISESDVLIVPAPGILGADPMPLRLPDNDMVIKPDGIDMFSDATVLCNDIETFGQGPSEIPLNQNGEPDASQLPDHCSLKHNLVARLKVDQLQNLPMGEQVIITKQIPKMLSEADTVDETTPED